VSRALALLVTVAGCGSHAVAVRELEVPQAGVALALYRGGDAGYGVVDDRRWIDVDTDHVLLSNIDPGAALASLVIESPDVQIGPCTRQRRPDAAAADAHGGRPEPVAPRGARFVPSVECAVKGAPGRYLVRIVYVSTTLTYRVQHELVVRESDTTTIDSRFAMQTPPWRTPASVVMFDGVPGGVEPPREIARGMLTLDGGTSVLVAPTRDVPSSLRYVFEGTRDGAADDGRDPSISWVWATLELPGVTLAPGNVRVHVTASAEDRWIDVPPRPVRDPDDTAPDAGAPLRLPLWVEESLRATRQRMTIDDDGVRSAESVLLSVANTGDTPREVLAIEHARKAKKRTLDRPWPEKPFTRGDAIVNKLTIKPGGVAKAGYVIVYED